MDLVFLGGAAEFCPQVVNCHALFESWKLREQIEWVDQQCMTTQNPKIENWINSTGDFLDSVA